MSTRQGTKEKGGLATDFADFTDFFFATEGVAQIRNPNPDESGLNPKQIRNSNDQNLKQRGNVGPFDRLRTAEKRVVFG